MFQRQQNWGDNFQLCPFAEFWNKRKEGGDGGEAFPAGVLAPGVLREKKGWGEAC